MSPVQSVEASDRLHLERRPARLEQFLAHLEQLPERFVRPGHRGQLEQRDPQARRRRVLSSPVIQHLSLAAGRFEQKK